MSDLPESSARSVVSTATAHSSWPATATADPKTLLSQWWTRHVDMCAAPVYEAWRDRDSGNWHASVVVQGVRFSCADTGAATKKRAEMDAATVALQALRSTPNRSSAHATAVVTAAASSQSASPAARPKCIPSQQVAPQPSAASAAAAVKSRVTCPLCRHRCNGPEGLKEHHSAKHQKNDAERARKREKQRQRDLELYGAVPALLPLGEYSSASQQSAATIESARAAAAAAPSRERRVGGRSSSMPARCRDCQAPAKFRCAVCKWATYCNEICQSLHWQFEHHGDCAPRDPRVAAIAKSVDFRPSVASRRDTPNPYQWNFKAVFHCPRGHRWSSHQAVVDINWRSLAVGKIYTQKCKSCDAIVAPDAALTTGSDFNSRVRSCFRELMGEDSPCGPREPRPEREHLSELCERCGFGAHPHAH